MMSLRLSPLLGSGSCRAPHCSRQPLIPRDHSSQHHTHPQWDLESAQWPCFTREFWKCWQLPVVSRAPPSCFHRGAGRSYASLPQPEWWQWHPLNISACRWGSQSLQRLLHPSRSSMRLERHWVPVTKWEHCFWQGGTGEPVACWSACSSTLGQGCLCCQPSCLPHRALEGRNVLSYLEQEEKQSLMHSEMPLLPHKGSILVPPEVLPMALKLSAFTQRPPQLPGIPDTAQ